MSKVNQNPNDETTLDDEITEDQNTGLPMWQKIGCVCLAATMLVAVGVGGYAVLSSGSASA